MVVSVWKSAKNCRFGAFLVISLSLTYEAIAKYSKKVYGYDTLSYVQSNPQALNNIQI